MTRKTRDDWTAVALQALAEGGVAAVAVEPLAARLGATKGSAYWHFPNRAALLEATLERWERTHTEAVIALVEAVPDALGRLRLLFGTVLERAEDAAVEAALLAAHDHPSVAPVLRRVTDRRMEYLVALFADAGFPPDAARRRSLLAYSVYVGQVQLLVAAPHVTPDRRALLEETLAVVTART